MSQESPSTQRKKPTIWYSQALREEIRGWPSGAREDIGEELNRVEYGGEPRDFKPMPTIGAGVNEIRTSDKGDQFRLIYVAKFEEAIYVLHIITKKKTQKTSQQDIEIAKALQSVDGVKEKTMSEEKPFTNGSGNIFIDLGFSEEEAAELSIKSCLFRKLQQALSESELSQTELAKKLGVKQPHVSEILTGKMSGFSTERIAKYLLRLNYDICLDAHPAPPGTNGGRVLEIEKNRLAATS